MKRAAPALVRPADLVGILTNLAATDFLFIDEIIACPARSRRSCTPRWRDYVVDVVLDQGPAARSMRLSLPRFTLVGATTREGLLSAPFRARFGPAGEVRPLFRRRVVGHSQTVGEGAAGRPRRQGGRFLSPSAAGARRASRTAFCAASATSPRSATTIASTAMWRPKGLTLLGIDRFGLCALDRRILEVLLQQGPRGRPQDDRGRHRRGRADDRGGLRTLPHSNAASSPGRRKAAAPVPQPRRWPAHRDRANCIDALDRPPRAPRRL